MIEEVTKMVEESRRLCRVSGEVNATFMALIPKIVGMNTLLEFLPISFCNTIYKLNSKGISNQIKPILSRFISHDQFGFLEKCQIHDVVSITQKCINSIKY